MTTIHIGSIIQFAGFDWRVLDIKHNAALLITEHIIEQRPYNDAYIDITWENSTLRHYLNGEFYDKFTNSEKSRILPVVNQNPDNQWYGTTGGSDTEDKIFILDIEETTCRYFGDSSANLYPTRKNKRYWFEKKDENNDKRIAKVSWDTNFPSWWWLRSPGRVGIKAAYVHGDGNIGIQGNNILKGNLSDGFCAGGVRPALWLKMSENEIIAIREHPEYLDRAVDYFSSKWRIS